MRRIVTGFQQALLLQTTCVWDNSATHGPIVNGQVQQPRDVRFGEGSTDEMCLAGFTLTDF